MNATYRKLVTVSAPAGTLSELGTIEGWERTDNGRQFVVTDPDWREDVEKAFGARVLSVEDA